MDFHNLWATVSMKLVQRPVVIPAAKSRCHMMPLPPPHNGHLSPTATFFYPQGGHCGKSSTLTAKINVPVGKQKLLVYACNTAAAIFMEHWGWLKYQPSVTVLGIRLKEGERRKKYACLNSHCSVGIMLENGAFDCCGVALYMANRSIPVSFIVS